MDTSVATIYTAQYLLSGSALIEGGALLDIDGRIAEVGALQTIRRGNEQAAVVDFGSAIILPPLVNAHTHLELTDFPRWNDSEGRGTRPASFVDWILQVIRVKHRIPQECYLSSLQRGIQLSLRAGTGLVGDILSYLPARNAYRNCGLQGRVYLEIIGQNRSDLQKKLTALKQVLLSWDKSNSVLAGLSPHSLYTLDSSFLTDLFHELEADHVFSAIHLAESAEEVEFLATQGGDIARKLYPFIGWERYLGAPAGHPPAKQLQRIDGLRADTLLVHGTQLTVDEIDLIARAGCSVVLCPRSNDRLGSGKAPLSALHQAGINLALGTDSMASNDSLSIWDELHFAARWFGHQVDSAQLFDMATTGGAISLGYRSDWGLVQPESSCNFQVLSPEDLPNPTDVIDFLVHEGHRATVSHLFLNGIDRLRSHDIPL